MAQPNQLNPVTQNLTVFDGALAGGNTWSSKPIALIEAYTSEVAAGVRQGLLNVNITRASTNALTSWDGNKDIAAKINAYNYAANGTNGAVEGLEILARNTGTGATCSLVKGLNITAENKTGAGTVQTMQSAMITMKNNGVVATSNYGLEIQDESQGTNPSATYPLRISTSTINPASGALTAAINLATKNTAGFSHAFYFENGSGLEGAYETGTVTGDTTTGYIKVKVGATTLRIKLFADAG